MRCKCCNSEKTRFVLDDWYCQKCASIIKRTIKEDKICYESEYLHYDKWGK